MWRFRIGTIFDIGEGAMSTSGGCSASKGICAQLLSPLGILESHDLPADIGRLASFGMTSRDGSHTAVRFNEDVRPSDPSWNVLPQSQSDRAAMVCKELALIRQDVPCEKGRDATCMPPMHLKRTSRSRWHGPRLQNNFQSVNLRCSS